MEPKNEPIHMFCAYASIDTKWWQRLETHLMILQRQKILVDWYGQPFPSKNIQSEKTWQALEIASLILLLISPEFLASDDSYTWSAQRVLEQQQLKNARIIPILLRPVDWQDTPFTYLQSLPTNDKPITSWRDRDQAFNNVLSSIRLTLSNSSTLCYPRLRAPLPNS